VQLLSKRFLNSLKLPVSYLSSSELHPQLMFVTNGQQPMRNARNGPMRKTGQKNDVIDWQ
jgi:hypothetical protein